MCLAYQFDYDTCLTAEELLKLFKLPVSYIGIIHLSYNIIVPEEKQTNSIMLEEELIDRRSVVIMASSVTQIYPPTSHPMVTITNMADIFK